MASRNEKSDEIGADESGAACDKDFQFVLGELGTADFANERG